MSIVEKAAERLRRQNRADTTKRPEDDPLEPVDTPARDYERDDEGAVRRIILDEVRLRRIGMMPPESMDLWLTREFQRIKRPLISRIQAGSAEPGGAPASRLMVTSADPGEGKSFTAFNLAMSLANELDYSVVLVDADVAKPGITRALGLEQESGLIHLLKEPEADIERAVIPTDQPRLSILPAGQRSRGAVERLASRRMTAVLDALDADGGRIIVLDSAPLLAAAESQALAVNAGQIVMVVRAGQTEQKAVSSAVSLIEPSGAEISFVLNQAHKLYDDPHAGYYGVYPGEPDRSE